MKKLLLILILVLLGVQTVSGWWFDDFTTNSVASYTGYNNVWDFEPTESNLTDQNFWIPRLFYNGETYSSGNFSFKFAKNATGSNVLRPRAYFGSADLYVNVDNALGNCAAGQTYYRVEAAGDVGGNSFYLDLCDAGAYTSLDTNAISSTWWRDDVWYYFIVNWDPAGLPSPQFPAGDTINVTTWKEGSADLIFLSSTDTTIASGYSGLGNGYWTIEYSWDWINFQALGVAPTPTPAPTPAPAPISVCTIKNMNITIEKGETWIKWNWSRSENITPFIIDTQDIYLNGTLFRTDYPHNYLDLTDIGSNSYQVLEVWGQNTTYCNCSQYLYSSVRSDPAYIWWYLIIGMGLLCIGYFVPLFGFLAIIILLLGFYMTYQEYTQSYIVLTYALSAIVAMIVTAFRTSGGMKK